MNTGFIRFYITLSGLVVTPIASNHWESYGVNISEQIINLNKSAPGATRSIKQRLENSADASLDSHHLLFVIGHIDEMMGGSIPEPDEDDNRTRDVDEK